MTGTPGLAGMHALLGLGRGPALLSLGLLLLALLLLGLPGDRPWPAAGLLLLSVAAGLLQAWFALRVALDAALLRLLLDEGLQGEAAAQRVDTLLQAAGLRIRPQAAMARGWAERWAGMCGLLLRQFVFTLLQVAGVLLAVLWPLP